MFLDGEASKVFRDRESTTDTCFNLNFRTCSSRKDPEYLIVKLLAVLVNIKWAHKVNVATCLGGKHSDCGQVYTLVLSKCIEKVNCDSLLYTFNCHLDVVIIGGRNDVFFLVRVVELWIIP